MLAVGDYGVGVPDNARRYYGLDHLPGALAMEWAFTPGMTTLKNAGARGLGLDFLREFVQKNNGRLEIYSHGGYAVVDPGGISYQSLGLYVSATVLTVTLSCDQGAYDLPSGQDVKQFEW